jgi:hypothetical protein
MTQPPSPLTMLFSHHTKRREFITLFCGTAAVPLAARGQPDRIRKVGILIAFSERDRVVQARVAAFREELRQLGRSEGCCPISVGPHRSMGQSEILEPRPLRRGRLVPDGGGGLAKLRLARREGRTLIYAGGWAPDGTIRRRAQSGERLSPLRGLRRRSPRRLKRRSLRENLSSALTNPSLMSAPGCAVSCPATE